jgi:hypothetical protein
MWSGCKILSWKNSRGETTWEMYGCIRGKYQKGFREEENIKKGFREIGCKDVECTEYKCLTSSSGERLKDSNTPPVP